VPDTQPPVEPTAAPATDPGVLPETGSSHLTNVAAAMGLLVLGAGLSRAARARRGTDRPGPLDT
jgi:LPXTG-motif cell wall-anchored protein